MIAALPINARHLLTAGLDQRILMACQRAIADIAAVVEDPLGSNRSPIIDGYNTRAGVPLGSYWCASAATAWWEDAGLAVPPTGRASCQELMHWAQQTKRWWPHPVVGALVLYGDASHAHHVGLIVRVSPCVLSIEGNTTVEGADADLSRNGTAVSQKTVNAADHVAGFVLPFPIGTATLGSMGTH